jgi:hypothetical protein
MKSRFRSALSDTRERYRTLKGGTGSVRREGYRVVLGSVRVADSGSAPRATEPPASTDTRPDPVRGFAPRRSRRAVQIPITPINIKEKLLSDSALATEKVQPLKGWVPRAQAPGPGTAPDDSATRPVGAGTRKVCPTCGRLVSPNPATRERTRRRLIAKYLAELPAVALGPDSKPTSAQVALARSIANLDLAIRALEDAGAELLDGQKALSAPARDLMDLLGRRTNLMSALFPRVRRGGRTW